MTNSFSKMIAIAMLASGVSVVGHASDYRCSDLFSTSPRLESSIDLKKASLPEVVVAYLRANPAYGKLYPQFSKMEEAYFQGRVSDDWEIYRRLVPQTTSSILDIGSGIGGVDLLLFHALQSPEVTLVDKAKREQDGVEYNVIEAAKDFLNVNGVPAEKVHALDAADPSLFQKLLQRQYDSIISLRGLGYMFPYGIYRDLILANLAPGGTLILDVRVMKAPTIHQTEVIKKRFEADGFKSEDAILKDLEQTIGTPEIVHTGTDYIRVRVVRTR